MTLVGLADDSDVGLSITTGVVTAGSGGSDGDESGDQELLKIFTVNFKVYLKSNFIFRYYQLHDGMVDGC